MLALNVILVASLSLSLVDASAIKGHAHSRHQEDARSIKIAPANNNIDKAAKLAPPSLAQAPAVPILESSKKVYNDESIRRMVAQSPVVDVPAKPAEQPAIVAAAPVQPIDQPAVVVAVPIVPVVPKESAPAPILVPVVSVPKDSVASPAVVQGAPIVSEMSPKIAPEAAPKIVSDVVPKVVPEVEAKVVAEVAPKIASEVAPKAASIEPVKAVELVKAAEPVKPVKQAEDLPPPSERSGPVVGADVPIVNKAVDQAVAAQPAVVAPIAEQPSVVQIQPAPIVPAAAAPLPIPVAAPVPAVVSEPVKVPDSPLQGKKEELQVEPLNIEVPAPDPGLVLSEPIDSTTKLLIDLDEHVQKFLPAEEQQQPVQPPKDPSLVPGVDFAPIASLPDPSGKSAPLSPYSSSVADEAIVPPLPALEGVEKSSGAQAAPPSPASQPSAPSSQAAPATRQGSNQNQNQQQVITQLMDQLDSLQNRIQDTINQLVARRRYVMSALLRPMGTYVRRVRTNLERLQNRVNQLQAAAVSVGANGQRPGGFVDAAAIETIRRRIDDISKRISDIVNRIRFSLTPTSAPLNSNGRK